MNKINYHLVTKELLDINIYIQKTHYDKLSPYRLIKILTVTQTIIQQDVLYV